LGTTLVAEQYELRCVIAATHGVSVNTVQRVAHAQ
jgi:hypothetical protein